MTHSVFIEQRIFKESYEWAKTQFGTPRNMLFRTNETNASWTVQRVIGKKLGHEFVFDLDSDLVRFKEHFGVNFD
jgi:hypothetical protein